MQGQRGYTLVEVLVVTVVLGILAAVALPVFAGQRQTAFDAEAKSTARAVQGAIETLAAGRGAYGLTEAEVLDDHPSLADGPAWTLPRGPELYSIRVVADGDGHRFFLRRTAAGQVRRSCEPAGAGGCGDGGGW